jgi:hypothetical protein
MENIPLGMSFGGAGAATMPGTAWQLQVGRYRVRRWIRRTRRTSQSMTSESSVPGNGAKPLPQRHQPGR